MTVYIIVWASCIFGIFLVTEVSSRYYFGNLRIKLLYSIIQTNYYNKAAMGKSDLVEGSGLFYLRRHKLLARLERESERLVQPNVPEVELYEDYIYAREREDERTRERESARERAPEWERERERIRKQERRHQSDLTAALKSSQKLRSLEFRIVIWLALLSGIAFLVAYLALRPIFADVQHGSFGPSETAQIITAAGGVGLAVGTSIAAVIKAFALLLHARADVIRARNGLPPTDAEGIETSKSRSELS